MFQLAFKQRNSKFRVPSRVVSELCSISFGCKKGMMRARATEKLCRVSSCATLNGRMHKQQTGCWERKISPKDSVSNVLPHFQLSWLFSFPNYMCKMYEEHLLFLLLWSGHNIYGWDEQSVVSNNRMCCMRNMEAQSILLGWGLRVTSALCSIITESSDTIGMDVVHNVQKEELEVSLSWYLYSLTSNMNH